jgi:hypothetical protein
MMPWKVQQHAKGCPGSKPYGVVKEDGTGLKGCHESRAKANKQMSALYANETDVKKGDDVVEVEEEMDEKCGGYRPYPPPGIYSFADYEDYEAGMEQAEELRKTSDVFNMLVSNILYSPEMTDRVGALKSLVAEYEDQLTSPPVQKGSSFIEWMKEKSGILRKGFGDGDYLEVADGKLVLLAERPGVFTQESLMQASHQAELLAKGMAQPLLSQVKGTIRRKMRDVGISYADMPVFVKGDEELSVWKEEGGRYRFFGIYSNQYEDNDSPPDILSEKAHKAFAMLTKEGIVEMPELWVWHTPGSRVGQATMVDYVDGFAVVAGFFDEGAEEKALAIKALIDSGADIGMSHGMPSSSILRRGDDEKVIDFYITKEVSVLPVPNAANKQTAFLSFKEAGNMAQLTDAVRTFLSEAGFDKSELAAIEDKLGQKKEAAEASGAQKKEEGEQTAPPTASDAPASAPDGITRDEVAEAIATAMGPLLQAIQALGQTQAAVVEEVKGLKETQTAIVGLSPKASISDMVTETLFGKENRTPPNSKLAKAAPEEKEGDGSDEKGAAPVVTGSGLLDMLLANSARAGTR